MSFIDPNGPARKQLQAIGVSSEAAVYICKLADELSASGIGFRIDGEDFIAGFYLKGCVVERKITNEDLDATDIDISKTAIDTLRDLHEKLLKFDAAERALGEPGMRMH